MGAKARKIAEIVFAVIFIGLLAVIFADILGFGRSGQKQLSGTMSNVSSTNLSNYDNVTVSGSEVVSAISNVKTLGGDLKLGIVVATVADSDGTRYGYALESGEGLYHVYGENSNVDLTNKLSEGSGFNTYSTKSDEHEYINPTASFQANLIKNKNDVTVGIQFVQDGVSTTNTGNGNTVPK